MQTFNASGAEGRPIHQTAIDYNPAQTVERIIHEPAATEEIMSQYLHAQDAYLDGKYTADSVDSAARKEHASAKGYRMVATAALAHVVSLQLMRHSLEHDRVPAQMVTETCQGAPHVFEPCAIDTVSAMARRVLDEAQDGPYRGLRNHFSQSAERVHRSLPGVAAYLPYELPSQEELLGRSASDVFAGDIMAGNVKETVMGYFLPRWIAQARLACDRPSSEALLQASYDILPTMQKVSPTTRKVSGEIRHGKALLKHEKEQLKLSGQRDTVSWLKALQHYEQTGDPAMIEMAANQYDAVLLQPDLPAVVHPALAHNERSGYCSGQFFTSPASDGDARLADRFYQSHGFSGMPSSGILPAEVLALRTLRVAANTIFQSEGWLDGLVIAGKAVQKAARSE